MRVIQTMDPHSLQSSMLPQPELSDQVICDLSNIYTLFSTLGHITSRVATDDGNVILEELLSLDASIIKSIERTQCAQRVLLSAQENVQDLIHTIQTMMAPVRKLPPELLCEIKRHYLSLDEFIQLPPPDICGQPSLLVFGQVCRQWRRVALMTPESWSSLHITIPQTLDNCKANRLKSLIHLLLERSENCSLRIRFTVFPVSITGEGWPAHTTNGLALRAVFEPFLLHAHRWWEVDFDITYAALEALLKDDALVSLPVPCLEAFHIRGDFGANDTRRLFNNPFRPLIKLSLAPALRRVSLFHVGLLAASGSSFSWSQLDELSAVGFFPGQIFFDCVTALQGCQRLTRCRISTSEYTRAFLNGAPIVLPSLEYLHIDEHGVPDGNGDLYLHMICSNLRELLIHFVAPARHNIQNHHLFWTCERISTFLSRAPRVRQLQLWDLPLDAGGLVEVLSFVPSLTHLTIGDLGSVCSITNQLLHELTLPLTRSEKRIPLKCLESIHIESRSCSEHYILGLVKSRCPSAHSASRLKRLRLYLPGTGQTATLRGSLEKFRHNGLNLDIRGSW
ncbi:hypothetical protein Hypma_016617 [Hypsizygus marmoreus]|uniref:Uncharacterized protein n=1 Tax=Hypsizygus marmoreus TaxID=39966 RepID=A0A369J6L8_HYPMA|nr:hypothetical protein Hypma_016617 [Hypsizygus marmoreus]